MQCNGGSSDGSTSTSLTGRAAGASEQLVARFIRKYKEKAALLCRDASGRPRPRYNGPPAGLVARFIAQRGDDIRTLLGADESELEEPPPEVDLLEAKLEAAGKQIAELAVEAARAKDAHRKAAEHLAERVKEDKDAKVLEAKLEKALLSKRVAHKEKRKAKKAAKAAKKKAAKLEQSQEAESESAGDDDDEWESDTDDSPPPPSIAEALELLPRRDEKGRWQAEGDPLHAMRLAQLARGVPSSVTAANIQDVLDVVAPGLEVPATCDRQSQLLRGEVTLTGEAMAAYKFAACKRVISFGWDESTKFGNSVFSCNFQLEMYDATVIDVCPRGLSILPDGGTSKALAEHIEKRILSYSRRILSDWLAAYDVANGAGSWAAAGHPSPANIGLHRLCDDTTLVTDTCNGARCTRRLVQAAVLTAIEAKVGKAAWEKLSEEERARKYQVHTCDCWQHLRNIIIEAMASACNETVKAAVEDDLAEFSSYERIDPEVMSLIRACFKQFHHGGEYCKGRGREFEAWRRKMKKTGAFIPFERAMGSRQDLAFDGAVALFRNRLICLEFLRGYLDCPKSQNILDKSLYTVLRSNEVVASLRVSVLWKYLFSEPFRWIAGKASKLKGWSYYKVGWALELVEKAMEEVVADPSRLLDPDFDIFAPVAAELPEFAAWRKEQLERKVLAEDGSEHDLLREVLSEARAPTEGSGNAQATPMVLKLAKAMAEAALKKMHDPKLALADKLESQHGAKAFRANLDAHSRVLDSHATNDAVENKFATADYIMRTFRNLSVFNASGAVQQRAAHDFDRPLNVVSDRRKRKTEPEQQQQLGFFWRLSKELRSSLLSMARRQRSAAAKVAAAEKLSHDEEKLLRREEAVQRQLNAVVDKYAEALELYDAWKAQGVKDQRDLEAALEGKSVTAQLEELRRQIEMRTIGLGWREFETKWSFFTDEKAHTIDKLRQMLLNDILPHERAMRRQKKLPKEAAPPQLRVRPVKKLGTVDVDVERLEASSIFQVENLRVKAEAARARREAAGVSDTVEVVQPPFPPPFDSKLVGKWLEVCWPYKENGTTTKIWATGRVVRVADGLTDTRSLRARKLLPAGALLWAWDADPEYDEPAGEQWLVLRPAKWNAQVQYAWRFDPRELCAAAPNRRRTAPRTPMMEEAVTDDERGDEMEER